MDLILDEYPAPLPLHPDDVVEGAESTEDTRPGDHFLRVNPEPSEPRPDPALPSKRQDKARAS
jgi:hypothetical protein